MAENIPDYDLRPPSDLPPPERPKVAKLWLAAALLAVVAAGAIYYLNARPPASAPQAQAPAAPKPAAPAPEPQVSVGLGRNPMAVDLPPINQSDALVRKLVAALSSHPSVAAWLVTDGLVRNFTVVVANIAEGEPPAVHVSRLRPSRRFLVIERNGDTIIDPRSYDRYTPLASAVAAIDPDGASRLYATLKPLIEQAHRDLGYGTTSFDVTLERAIVRLLSTPTIADPVRVVPHGIVYAFEDPRIEKLTPGQKHLLRFGPGNMQTVQQSLRNIALALGIPEDRLPE
jgi:hypothetical protein